MAQLPLIHNSGLQTNLWQTRVKSILDQILANKILQGRQINASLVSGSNQLNHGLSRQPLGWLLTDITGPAVIWRLSWSASTITINASVSATTTASFLVF